jgi:hypothetical protein
MVHIFCQITSQHVGIIRQVHGLQKEKLQVISIHYKEEIDMGD